MTHSSHSVGDIMKINKVSIILISFLLLMITSFVILYIISTMKEQVTIELIREQAQVMDFNFILPGEAIHDSERRIPIDFDALQRLNEDIYAWIRIPGLNIDYPIVQSVDDPSYYTRRDFKRKPSMFGAIFTLPDECREFTESNTIIYGYKSMNDRMFGPLKQYLDTSFMSEFDTIKIFTPTNIYTYQVFAAMKHNSMSFMQSNQFYFAQSFESLDSILNGKYTDKIQNSDIEIKPEDRVITLSTSNLLSNQRYLIRAVLVQVEYN